MASVEAAAIRVMITNTAAIARAEPARRAKSETSASGLVREVLTGSAKGIRQTYPSGREGASDPSISPLWALLLHQPGHEPARPVVVPLVENRRAGWRHHVAVAGSEVVKGNPSANGRALDTGPAAQIGSDLPAAIPGTYAVRGWLTNSGQLFDPIDNNRESGVVDAAAPCPQLS
jgi:hypothetical protein